MADNEMNNEAEFQARLEAQIRAALPLLPAQIKLERHLNLRLGHHTIIIDGLETKVDGVRGRYDLLVLVNGDPLLLAELKAPGVKIEDDDIRQALSYARLHEPMVPLVLITNGDVKVLRRTYDGGELQETDISADRLKSVLSAAASLAASASEDAVRTLLGDSSDTWVQICAVWTSEAVATLTGKVRDFKYPLVQEFNIPRKVTSLIEERLTHGARVLVLHGSPLAGVTNSLAQLAANNAAGPRLYVDGNATTDILQFIANRLSRELSFKVTKDDLRGWLNSRRGLVKLTLVIDGLPKVGTDELVEFANADLLRLVFGINSETYNKNATIGGRVQKSLFGHSAVDIKLLPLSDAEFNDALIVYNKSLHATFYPGAQHALEFRWPRMLRVLAAALPNKADAGVDAKSHTVSMLPSVPGPMLLDMCNEAFVSTPELKYDLQKLAAAFLKDAARHIKESGWLAATWGHPSIDPDIVTNTVGDAGIKRLIEYGLLSWVDTPGLGPRLLIRVEELLAHYVADEWSISLAKLSDKEQIIKELDRLFLLSSAVPAGEIPLAAAIFRATRKQAIILSVAIPYLMQHQPTKWRLGEGAQVDLLVQGGSIHLLFGEGMDEEVIGDVQYWLVLSHLAFFPMGKRGDHRQSVNFLIFAKLGVSRHLLYQPRPSEVAEVAGLHFHDIDGIGSVPCLHTGIVEPLLQAMLNLAHIYPDEIVSLAQLAMDKKEAHLAWRVLTVAIVAKTSTNEIVQRAAKDVEDVLKDWWGNAMKEAFGHGDSESR